MNIDEIYSALIDNGLFTEEELSLITNINGYNIETLNDCAYARYGIREAYDLVNDDAYF